MKKKIKLNTVSEFPKNFIGIASHHKEIRVVWLLNNLTGLSFSKTNDFVKETKGAKSNQKFSMFQFTEEQNNYFLIANKNNETFLFPKYKTIDYIFISNLASEKLSEISSGLSKSEIIIGNFILPADKLISDTLRKLFED